MTDAVASGRAGDGAWCGGVVAALAIMSLTFGNFAHVAFFELAEIAELDVVEQIMMLSNGSAGIEHHERSDYADMLTVVQPELRRFPNAMSSLFNTFGLIL